MKLKRFLQEPGDCALASSATVANYYNKNINYHFVKQSTNYNNEGLWTPEVGLLLNNLGFQSVTIVTCDLEQFDFSWKNLSRKQIINRLKKYKRFYKWENKEIAKKYIKFLENKENNFLIIDSNFGSYIRKGLSDGIPVLISFNWNMFFEFPKMTDNKLDPVQGNTESHMVAVYDYDDKGVYILDSHNQYYKGKLKKYRTGRYFMDWEKLHTVMGYGDVIIPANYELV